MSQDGGSHRHGHSHQVHGNAAQPAEPALHPPRQENVAMVGPEDDRGQHRDLEVVAAAVGAHRELAGGRARPHLLLVGVRVPDRDVARVDQERRREDLPRLEPDLGEAPVVLRVADRPEVRIEVKAAADLGRRAGQQLGEPFRLLVAALERPARVDRPRRPRARCATGRPGTPWRRGARGRRRGSGSLSPSRDALSPVCQPCGEQLESLTESLDGSGLEQERQRGGRANQVLHRAERGASQDRQSARLERPTGG